MTHALPISSIVARPMSSEPTTHTTRLERTPSEELIRVAVAITAFTAPKQLSNHEQTSAGAPFSSRPGDLDETSKWDAVTTASAGSATEVPGDSETPFSCA